jgi:hypothetical protein
MGRARRDSRAWYLLLLLPLAGTLVPTLYNTEDPTLAGIPFFYWYQLLWVPLSVLVTWTVYRKTSREP